ncbi:peptidoglycan-binding protein [Thalassobacillus devorans]|uniref:peptidoglycan-binding protein n=1 Tax=Thalassobacillus devorans TaxID=279813 RepID=UPI000A1C8DA1|nr:peptidoglycan-binding protein [Thalassobacillus devorans]
MAMESRDLFENPVRYTAGEVTIEPESSYLLKEGMVHTDLVEAKMKLNWLGYGQSKITTKFGAYFKDQVMKFQEDHELAATGMVDYRTNRKIKEAFAIAFRPDSKYKRIRRFQSTLERLGFGEIGNKAQLKRCLMDFQKHYQLKVTGSLDFVTFSKMNDILSSPYQTGEEHQEVITLKSKLNSLGYGRIQLTPKFGKKTERMVKKFQADYGLPVSGIADDITMEKLNNAQRIKEKVTYSRYDITFEEVLKKQSISEVGMDNHPIMLNPNNFINDEKMKFLFIDLFRTNVTTVSELNNLLDGKGLLEGKGHLFIEIAKAWNINEVFLVSHVVKNCNITPDSDLEAVIINDAKLLQEEYGTSNNTLYKIYFDPTNLHKQDPDTPKKDINWLTNQLEVLYEIYQTLNSYTLYLEIPVFKDRPAEKYIRG